MFFFRKAAVRLIFFSLESIQQKPRDFAVFFWSLAKPQDHQGSLNESELRILSFEVSNLELAAWPILFWDYNAFTLSAIILDQLAGPESGSTMNF